ncbi:MAG TPA: phosphohistidine phosphatase SixA [Vicinamibacterales bacterium]|nr:phosphohistidine phosphatase SixA [Vicinamibacterales bacterium]
MPGPYELYLIRHAIAAERGEAWPDDAKRPLTEDGIDRMRKAARGLSRLDVTIDLVLTSPLVRAKQTAEIVAAAIDTRPPVTVIESLAPGASYNALMADLEKHARKSRIALVGHEPGIGELAARFIGSRHAIEFKKGAVCRIDLEEIPPAGPGDLRWFLTPRFLRAVKK